MNLINQQPTTSAFYVNLGLALASNFPRCSERDTCNSLLLSHVTNQKHRGFKMEALTSVKIFLVAVIVTAVLPGITLSYGKKCTVF